MTREPFVHSTAVILVTQHRNAFQAVCNCGWSGRYRPTTTDAEEEATQHRAASRIERWGKENVR